MTAIDHKGTRDLFNYLDSNRKNFTRLQLEFIDNLRTHFKATGLLTSIQTDSLLWMKEKINSYKNFPDKDFISGLYNQLQEKFC